MTSLKGADAAPTARSDVSHRGNAGWPTAGDRYGHGVPVVLVGVTTHRGGQESRPQGEGAQASAMGREVGVMPSAETAKPSPTGWAVRRWKAQCDENCTLRLGRG